MTSVKKIVKRGTAYLDEQLGAGWWDAIDLERLNLESTRDCVLAQLNTAGLIPTPDGSEWKNPYSRAQEQLDIWGGFCSDNGFSPGDRASAAQLNAEWSRVIEKRRKFFGAAPKLTLSESQVARLKALVERHASDIDSDLYAIRDLSQATSAINLEKVLADGEQALDDLREIQAFLEKVEVV